MDQEFWSRFFTPHALTLVGTREPDGGHDLAPKHLSMPLGWGPWFGFVCTPEHRTWRNVERTEAFTIGYIGPDQVVAGGLAAAPRCDGGAKPTLEAVPTRPATVVDGVLVEGSPVSLECTLDRIVGDLGDNGLIIGHVVAVHVAESALRREDRDDADLLFEQGVLTYIDPFRFADVRRTDAFPLPPGFRR